MNAVKAHLLLVAGATLDGSRYVEDGDDSGHQRRDETISQIRGEFRKSLRSAPFDSDIVVCAGGCSGTCQAVLSEAPRRQRLVGQERRWLDFLETALAEGLC